MRILLYLFKNIYYSRNVSYNFRRYGESVTETQRKFCTRHGIKRKTDAPSVTTISNIIQNFKTNGCVNTSYCNGRGKDKELTQRLSSSFEEMDAIGHHISVSALSKKACCTCISPQRIKTFSIQNYHWTSS